jgi:hypothetical protein
LWSPFHPRVVWLFVPFPKLRLGTSFILQTTRSRFCLHGNQQSESRLDNGVISINLSRTCFRFIHFFLFPQRTHYFWRVFRFLFMEHKQDYSVASVKDVKVCFYRRKTVRTSLVLSFLLF